MTNGNDKSLESWIWDAACSIRGAKDAAKFKDFNRIVTAYLEFAELQALSRKPMTMRDWIAKLDDFLRMGDRDILTHTGTISHEQALKRAELEFEKFRALQLEQPSPVEKDFEAAVKKLAKAGKPGKAG